MCLTEEILEILGKVVLYCIIRYEGEEVMVEHDLDGKIVSKSLQFCLRRSLLGIVDRHSNPLRTFFPFARSYSLSYYEYVTV